MSLLQAGFGLVEISPLVGTPLAGYLRARYATRVHDPLFARALALSDGSTSVLLLSCDLLALAHEEVAAIRREISQCLPVLPDHIFLLATHIHTGPATVSAFETPKAEEYADALPGKVLRAAETAWYDLALANAMVVRREVPGVGFERRYRMKDGTTRTNPGVGNPDIVEPYRKIRTPLSLLGFERDATRLPIVLAIYPCHADVVGGTEVSADFPGRTCNDLTHRLPGHPEVLFARGPAGDINHIDVSNPQPQSGYDHAKRMAKLLADAAVEMWPDRAEVSGALAVRSEVISLPRRPVEQEALRAARTGLTHAQPDGGLSEENLWARELVMLSEMPEELPVEIAAILVGDLAFVALPGEPFSALGEEIERRSLFRHTLVADCAGGGFGYLPPEECYGQHGYEERPARSSPFAPGSGEKFVEAAVALLKG